MQAVITKEFSFAAAHQLLNHDGLCRNRHGHNYRVIVEVSGEIKGTDGKPDEGMVQDFGVVKARWKEIEPLLDHRDLNESIGTVIGPTTAENIAVWILSQFDAASAVTVFETATSSAMVRR